MNIMDWVNQIYPEEIYLMIAGAIIGGMVFVYCQIFKRLTPVKEDTEPEEELEEFPIQELSRELLKQRRYEMSELHSGFPDVHEGLGFRLQEDLVVYDFWFSADRGAGIIAMASRNGGYPNGEPELDRAIERTFQQMHAPFRVVRLLQPRNKFKRVLIKIIEKEERKQ